MAEVIGFLKCSKNATFIFVIVIIIDLKFENILVIEIY